MPTDPTRAQAVFLAAADLADPSERAAYLNRECAGDLTLRHRVDALLRAHDQPDSLLDAPIVPAAGGETRTQTPPEQADTRTHGDGAPEDDLADALSVLAPPGRPDSLGRIGHYEVLEVLGRGGFGIVYRAFDDVLQRVVAVKVLAPAMAATSPARKRFLREARSSAQVRHENVVHVYAVEEQPLPYLVMEFVPGETLQQRLDRTGPLDVPEVLRIGRQVAAGLAAAHDQGLIHRDIKPSNILIDSGPRQQVNITDFGLARAADDASLTRSGAVAGTPMFMAPEQARGEQLDHRADLFSLGSVLYTALTGRPPFRAASTLGVLKRVAEDDPRPIREIIPEVPSWLCRIVEKLHAKHPAGRFQTAREVADLLADCEQQVKEHGRLQDSTRIPSAERQARRRSRSPVGLVILIVALVLGLPVLGILLAGAWYFTAIPANRDQNPVRLPTERDGQVVGAADRDADGWEPLFNGKDLTGWQASERSPGVWQVKQGVLVGTQGPGFLLSKVKYQDFHLRAEVLVEPGGNAGINFRGAFRAEISGRPKAPSGSLVRLADKVAVSFTPYPHTTVHPDTWFLLEVRAVGPEVAVRVNDHPWMTAPAGADTEPARIDLEGRADTIVRFRKIEIRELPRAKAPEVPRRAADVLPFLVGTWKVERQELDPKGPPPVGPAVGHVTYEFVADGQVLRVRGWDGPGGSDIHFLCTFDQARNVLQTWQAWANGDLHGPSVGLFNPDNRTLQYRLKLADGVESHHQFDFVDANTFRTRLFYQDASNTIVRESRMRFTRAPELATPSAHPIDPKRPRETAVLGRLAGQWQTDLTLTRPAMPGQTTAQTIRVRVNPILGGRFYEVFESYHPEGHTNYALAWYDAGARQYRQWFFGATGPAKELTGTWDEASKALTWTSADGLVTRRSTFAVDDRREVRDTVRSPDGKVATEITGVSRRVAAGAKK